MLTEEEAKKTWCPYTQLAACGGEWHTNRPSFRDVNDQGFDLCMGSRCGAWRWVPRSENYSEDQYGIKTHLEPIGYCGRAGKS